MKREYLVFLGAIVVFSCVAVGCRDDTKVTAPTVEPPPRFYYPSAIGDTWVYSNRFGKVYSQDPYLYESEDLRGVQHWKVDSLTGTDTAQVVLISVASRDTIRFLRVERSGWNAPRDTTMDSTAIRDTSVSVMLRITRDSISIDMGAAVANFHWYFGRNIQFSRLLALGQDTVALMDGEIHGFNFVDGIGLVYWRNDESGIGKGARETLTLVDYSVQQKPRQTAGG